MVATVAGSLIRLQPVLWRGGEWCLLAYLFLVPFPTNTATLRGFTLAAALLFWALAQASGPGIRGRRGALDAWIVAYLGVVVVSILLATDPWESARQFRSSGLKHLAVYLLVSEHLRRGADVNGVLITALASSSLIVLYGYWSFWWLGIMSDGKPVSVFSYQNDLSHYLLVPCLVLVWYLGRERRWSMQAAWGAVLMLHLGLLLLTQARASIMAFVASSVTMAVALRRRLPVYLLASLLVLALPLGVFGDSRLLGRYASMFHWKTYVIEQARMRGEAWRTTVTLIGARPVLGHGYGWKSFATQAPTPRSVDPGRPEQVVHAHNIFLEVAYEGGLVGLTAFLGLWVSVVAVTLRNIRQRADPLVPEINVLALCVFVTALIVGFTDIAFWYERVGTLTWAFIGIVAGTAALASGERPPGKRVTSP
jgi:putative inorganic carbon (HCO3(-)) transporter